MSPCAHAETCRFHDPDEATLEVIREEIREELGIAEPSFKTHILEALPVLESFLGIPLAMADAYAFEQALAKEGFRIVQDRS